MKLLLGSRRTPLGWMWRVLDAHQTWHLGQCEGLPTLVPVQRSWYFLNVHKGLGFATVRDKLLSLKYTVLEAEVEIQLLGVYSRNIYRELYIEVLRQYWRGKWGPGYPCPWKAHNSTATDRKQSDSDPAREKHARGVCKDKKSQRKCARYNRWFEGLWCASTVCFLASLWA